MSEKNCATFETEAREITVEGCPLVAVWTDGLSLSSDNGHFAGLPGKSHCEMTLTPGRRYRVTVEEINTAEYGNPRDGCSAL